VSPTRSLAEVAQRVDQRPKAAFRFVGVAIERLASFCAVPSCAGHRFGGQENWVFLDQAPFWVIKLRRRRFRRFGFELLVRREIRISFRRRCGRFARLPELPESLIRSGRRAGRIRSSPWAGMPRHRGAAVKLGVAHLAGQSLRLRSRGPPVRAICKASLTSSDRDDFLLGRPRSCQISS
jgi:hypothetical protein